MFGWIHKHTHRRRQVREHRVRETGGVRGRLWKLLSWETLTSAVFVAVVSAIGFFGDSGFEFAIGQRIEHPIYAKVAFRVPDPKQTAANRASARASIPSHYAWNASGVTFDRIRADLIRIHELAVDSESPEQYLAALEGMGFTADPDAYAYLRKQAAQVQTSSRTPFQKLVEDLPLESEYVVRNQPREPREPASTSEFVVLETPGPDGAITASTIPVGSLVRQENEKALRGSASDLAKRFPQPVRATVEAVVLATLAKQPTIVYNADRTADKMREAEQAIPDAMVSFEPGKPFVTPGILGLDELALLRAHHAAFLAYLEGTDGGAKAMRSVRLLQRAGMVTLMAAIAAGLLLYGHMNRTDTFAGQGQLLGVTALTLGTLITARALDINWPHIPELVSIPCLLAANVLAIVHPRRFALGAACVIAALVAAAVRADLGFALALLMGVAAAVYQLDEIRSRTKLIKVGAVTALVMAIGSAANGFLAAHSRDYVLEHSIGAGACALLAAFVISGVLPYIERVFRVATSLTLLEWRDPTRPLLQLLAREAPGTYNHSLLLGTLAQAACERIGANGLLAQVGALYHDIGKIPKAEYFTENQEGLISRHDNLAPSMSLLIILGHVKDGLEMAREYKLPRVLHQFIEQHHGTSVVRYFHQIASEKQPKIARGKHDREVPEAEFRYGGPKPQTREAAVLMLGDGVEGAVRALADPNVGRIESAVHQIVRERLNDGQLDDCDITLKEIRQVEESLVKSLCAVHHGRVSYPKSRKGLDEPFEPARVSV